MQRLTPILVFSCFPCWWTEETDPGLYTYDYLFAQEYHGQLWTIDKFKRLWTHLQNQLDVSLILNVFWWLIYRQRIITIRIRLHFDISKEYISMSLTYWQSTAFNNLNIGKWTLFYESIVEAPVNNLWFYWQISLKRPLQSERQNVWKRNIIWVTFVEKVF